MPTTKKHAESTGMDQRITPEIEKGIPLPERVYVVLSKPSIFAPMTVGDSIFFAGRNQTTVSAMAGGYAKRHGWKMSVRSVTKSGVSGTRVWRTA